MCLFPPEVAALVYPGQVDLANILESVTSAVVDSCHGAGVRGGLGRGDSGPLRRHVAGAFLFLRYHAEAREDESQ